MRKGKSMNVESIKTVIHRIKNMKNIDKENYGYRIGEAIALKALKDVLL